ncbi:MAG: hypothetical protein CMA88_03235 [Euryarchaeota archaeon]|nr:hypothetical protein [Euryarchaeota archaeon]|tara:strand:+ start:304 stop:573 length:270 start_codon:yes stop_codon:yes gene_type:complete
MIPRRIGVVVSAVLASVSVIIMVFEKAITAQAWGLLLLTPFPMVFSLSNDSEIEKIDILVGNEWPDYEIDGEAEGVGDPVEAGFDLPVL